MKTNSKETQLNIKQFVQCVMEKNYAQADKYLQAAIQHKIQNRMERAKQKNIFKQS